MKHIFFTLLLSLVINFVYCQTQFTTYKTSQGLMKQSGYFTDSKLDSVWVQYNASGDTIAVAHYRLGIKHGVWMWKQNTQLHKLYYNQGKKQRYEIYDNGILITQKDL
jgi:antitoxin component YwqK of YwqJK toxin-antitoxin module